eukprot:2810076-Prymnesium_polylepis.1
MFLFLARPYQRDDITIIALGGEAFKFLPNCLLPTRLTLSVETQSLTKLLYDSSIGNRSHFVHGAMHPAVYVSARSGSQVAHPYSWVSVHGLPGGDSNCHQSRISCHLHITLAISNEVPQTNAGSMLEQQSRSSHSRAESWDA